MSTASLLPYRDDQEARPPHASLTNRDSSGSQITFTDSPYTGISRGSLVADKFSLPPDPAAWGSNVDINNHEADDDLHNPNSSRGARRDSSGTILTFRGLMNLGCLAILLTAMLTLFMGYPLISHFNSKQPYNHASIKTSFTDAWQLIDPDTPEDVKTRSGYEDDSSEFTLVFSDEFNTDGRSFYAGDDPYWEAVDLYNWATADLEYSVNTSGGYLHITLSKKENHNLDYTSAMLTSWNKFCFTGGIFEVSLRLPGKNDVSGLWPAVWTMGNLGRVGYGATLDGVWPYTYDSCDVGTLQNQTLNGMPEAALTSGSSKYNYTLSYLPGQRLSRCTCKGQSHPGPKHKDGTYVGRSAPEIDVFEAQIDAHHGTVSQSAQWGPFDEGYHWHNTSDGFKIVNSSRSVVNSYSGGVYQEATSVVSYTDQQCYELEGGCFSTYGFEYKPGFDDAYISWINADELMWTLYPAGVGADSNVNISARPISQEPMYILMNLAISPGFATIEYDELVFPTTMSIDWVRVYQRSDMTNYGCDPEDFPTAAYISKYDEAYSNYNLTTWALMSSFSDTKFLGRLLDG
ncbi:glycoside hydrolase family 16 protein [Fistulina hepatica ATCC 64428]|nr:glycoside hydrolase family 16 protein [Fistulina hepatica ATCC 64428]